MFFFVVNRSLNMRNFFALVFAVTVVNVAVGDTVVNVAVGDAVVNRLRRRALPDLSGSNVVKFFTAAIYEFFV
jgi:hypothetical protein